LNINEDYFNEKLRACNGNNTCILDFSDPTNSIFDGTYDAEGVCGKKAKVFV